MVIDTSAILAILFNEPERRVFEALRPSPKVPAPAPWDRWRLAGIQENGPKARP